MYRDENVGFDLRLEPASPYRPTAPLCNHYNHHTAAVVYIVPILYSCVMRVFNNIVLCLFFLFIILHYRYYFYFNGRGIQYYYNDRLRAHTRAQNKPLWM